MAQDGDRAAGLPVGGPDALALGPQPRQATPVPPPYFCTMAISDAVRMMSSMLSSRGRTKQADSVPALVPAFIRVGELGRNSSRAMDR